MFISTAYAAGEDVANSADAGVFPPFDASNFASQIFWLAITFGFLYWFISKTISPRIGEILETRQDRIARDLDKARELSEQTDEAIAAYEQELAQARNSANEIGQKARDAAKADADAKRKAVEDQLAEKLAEAEKSIAAIKEKAMAEVGGIAKETTGEVIAQLIGTKVTAADLNAAIAAAKS